MLESNKEEEEAECHLHADGGHDPLRARVAVLDRQQRREHLRPKSIVRISAGMFWLRAQVNSSSQNCF